MHLILKWRTFLVNHNGTYAICSNNNFRFVYTHETICFPVVILFADYKLLEWFFDAANKTGYKKFIWIGSVSS